MSQSIISQRKHFWLLMYKMLLNFIFLFFSSICVTIFLVEFLFYLNSLQTTYLSGEKAVWRIFSLKLTVVLELDFIYESQNKSAAHLYFSIKKRDMCKVFFMCIYLQPVLISVYRKYNFNLMRHQVCIRNIVIGNIF